MPEANSKDDTTLVSEFWSNSLLELKGELDPQIYSAFIKPLRLQAFNEDDGEFEVCAPSRLICNHVNQNFRGRIERALCDCLGKEGVRLRLSVSKDPQEAPRSSSSYLVIKKTRSKPATKNGSQANESDFRSNINPRYTFDSFVVGSSNQFCHAAAMRVAENPGAEYNPLFIYGGVGLGKTHLMHAIGNAVLKNNPSAQVLYLSSESFTNDLIQSLRYGKMEEFKNRIRNIDLLLIDDIQFMCGKERTQEEFFHTFNALYNAKHQIVLTSDKVPQDIPGIEERLRTRFSWGLTADLQAPDFETRVAILKRKATLDKFTLGEDVAHFVAEQVSSNVRELEGALTRLHAMASLQNKSVSLDLAQTALEPLLVSKKVYISVDDIKRVVSDHFQIKVSEMVSKRRTKNLSFPRHIAMYLCRKHTTCSYPEIGSHFGGRDHSSVIHAANVVAAKIKASSDVRAHIERIEQLLMG